MKTALRSRHVIVLIVIALCIGLISGCLKSKGGGSGQAIIEAEHLEAEINPAKWFEAVRWGSVEEIQELLAQGVDPDVIFDDGESALHVAVEQDNFELVELLLTYGGDVNIQERKGGYTALMYAAIMDDRKMMQLLIDHGADPTVDDLDGYSSRNLFIVAYRAATPSHSTPWPFL